jgi:hypothetical protein
LGETDTVEAVLLLLTVRVSVPELVCRTPEEPL